MEEFARGRSSQLTADRLSRSNVDLSQARLLSANWRAWLVAVPLVLIVVYAFSPSLANGFVVWDDDKNFIENPYFRGLGLAQVKWAWTTFWFGAYQPLTWLLFEAQYVLWQVDPWGYHFTSLLLQVANGLVLYALTLTLLVRCRVGCCLENPWTCFVSAGLATALFVVHPLRVEAVAWATCQSYLCCILFSMLAVLAYFRAFPTNSSPRWRWLAGSFLLFVAALLFHALPVTLPAVFLILDVYPLGRLSDESGRRFGVSVRRVLFEKLPFFMTSLVFMGLAIAAKPQTTLPVESYDASEGIAQACYGICFYFQKTALPLDLIAFYPRPTKLNWLAFPYVLCILIALATSAVSFVLRRRVPGLLAAWLSYLLILAPNSGFIRICDQIAADRYSYMSMVGFVALAAAGFCWLWNKSLLGQPGAFGILVIGLGTLLGLTALTRNQCRTWRDSETMWTHALAHGANLSELPHNNLGIFLYTQGKYKEAEAHLAEAMRFNAGAASHINLGTIFWHTGKYKEAKAELAEAIRLDPGEASAHNNLGAFLFTEGKYEDAVVQFAEALRLNPDYDQAHNNLGAILYAQGKYDEAEAHVAAALRLNPHLDQAQNNMGKILSRRGNQQAAEAHFAQALRLNPDFAEAHNNLGLALQTRGSHQAAEAHFADAVRLDPGFANAHYNLGVAFFVRGSYEPAEARFAEALRLEPGFGDAHFNLGIVLFTLGNYGAAKAHFADAVRLKPGDPDACNASAMLMAACPEAKFRDGKEAIRLATRACELTQWKNPSCLNTLAAGQAEAGDFDAAVKSQNRAIELVTDERQKDDYRSRLVLYRAKKPYRQVSPRRVPSAARS